MLMFEISLLWKALFTSIIFFFVLFSSGKVEKNKNCKKVETEKQNKQARGPSGKLFVW